MTANTPLYLRHRQDRKPDASDIYQAAGYLMYQLVDMIEDAAHEVADGSFIVKVAEFGPEWDVIVSWSEEP